MIVLSPPMVSWREGHVFTRPSAALRSPVPPTAMIPWRGLGSIGETLGRDMVPHHTIRERFRARAVELERAHACFFSHLLVERRFARVICLFCVASREWPHMV